MEHFVGDPPRTRPLINGQPNEFWANTQTVASLTKNAAGIQPRTSMVLPDAATPYLSSFFLFPYMRTT